MLRISRGAVARNAEDSSNFVQGSMHFTGVGPAKCRIVENATEKQLCSISPESCSRNAALSANLIHCQAIACGGSSASRRTLTKVAKAWHFAFCTIWRIVRTNFETNSLNSVGRRMGSKDFGDCYEFRETRAREIRNSR